MEEDGLLVKEIVRSLSYKYCIVTIDSWRSSSTYFKTSPMGN